MDPLHAQFVQKAFTRNYIGNCQPNWETICDIVVAKLQPYSLAPAALTSAPFFTSKSRPRFHPAH
jgi:hypothetical protein